MTRSISQRATTFLLNISLPAVTPSLRHFRTSRMEQEDVHLSQIISVVLSMYRMIPVGIVLVVRSPFSITFLYCIQIEPPASLNCQDA